jgi:hypothetical protein
MSNFTKIFLNSNIRLMLYSGDFDSVCNFLIGQKFSEQIGIKV